MAENEKKVIYRAVADFAALSRASKAARKDMADLRKEAEKTNASQVTGAKNVETANSRAARSVNNMRSARDKAAAAAKNEEQAVKSAAEAVAEEATAHDKATRSTNTHKGAVGGLTGFLLRGATALLTNAAAASKHANATDKATKSTVRFQSGFANMIGRLGIGTRQLQSAANATEKLGKKISDVFSKRSQVGGLPFGLLVPVILAVISAINPLIALMGAASGAAIGFANSLGSLSGVALALPGIFAAVASGIAGVIVAFGGVGKVFKAFSQKQASGGGGGGGGGGQTAADREKQLADAEDRLARAQRGVLRAQNALNEARKQAIRDLEDLRKAVSRASSDEADAVAALAQAQQNYNNIFADSGSTAADKLQAAADLTDAQNNLDDTRQQNIRNQQDLNEAEKKGVEGSDAVVNAQDNLTDAIKEQNDALYDLKKTQAGMTGGGGGGGGGGFDALQAALDDLSPSARAFALGILSMADAWKKLRQNVQENFFSKIVGDLDRIRGFLPTLDNLLSKAAGAMGDVAHNAILMVTSGPWTKDFGTIADNNVEIIHSLGDAALSLLSALKDITVAAGPFTKLLVSDFAKGAENFAKMVATARDNGSLAAWLEKVNGRLHDWWDIISNIGATIFNFGKAASGLGDDLTKGFKGITEGWKKASEEANNPNSGFQKWLKDIRPVISELKKDFSAFFGWLGNTAGSNSNLKNVQGILESIRSDLGPAVAKLLDTFSKTSIPETLIKGITDIVNSIDKILKGGGASGIQAFFDILKTFFDVVANVVSIPGVGPTLGTIAGTLAAIGAIKFAAKFSGIEFLIDKLISFSDKGNPMKDVESSLGNMEKMSFSGLIAAAAAITAIAGAAVGVSSTTSSIIDAINKTNDPKATPEQRQDANAQAYGASIRTPIAGIEGLLKVFGVDTSGFDKWVDKTFKPISDFANGGKAGASLTTDQKLRMALNPNGTGLDKNGNFDIGKFFSDSGDFWTKLFGGGNNNSTPSLGGGGGGGRGMVATGRGNAPQQATNPWENGAKQIGDFFGGFKMPDFGKMFSGFKMPDLGKIFTDLNPFKGIKLPDFGALFKGQNPFGFLKLPDFGSVFKGQNPFGFLNLPDFGGLFKGQNPFSFLKLPDFGGLFKGQNPFSWLKLPDFGGLFKGQNPFSWLKLPDFGAIFKWQIPGLSWPNFGSIFGSILPSAYTIGQNIYNAVANAFSGVGGWLRQIFGSKGGQVKAGAKARKNKPAPAAGGPVNTGTGGRGKGSKAFWTGGWATLASGGRALENRPGSERPRQVGTDTVPAMLTLGEFVLRKGVVESIGVKNLNALNEGLISYSDMLNLAMGNQKTQQKQKSKYSSGTDVAQYLSGGGLAGVDHPMPPINRVPAAALNLSIPPAQVASGLTVEQMHIHNPKPERASDSLPRSIRKAAYLGDRKPATRPPTTTTVTAD